MTIDIQALRELEAAGDALKLDEGRRLLEEAKTSDMAFTSLDQWQNWLVGRGAALLAFAESSRNSIVPLLDELETLRTVDICFRHAIACVDAVFQEIPGQPPPLLPEFLLLGDDKFEGVKKLASEYLSLRSEVARLRGETIGIRLGGVSGDITFRESP